MLENGSLPAPPHHGGDSRPDQGSSSPVDFSPPLIAMVVIIATAFVIITYSRLLSRCLLGNYRRYRRWRLRRRVYVPSSSGGEVESQAQSSDPVNGFRVFSPYGADESMIKTIPLSVYTGKSGFHDCAVCLLEFEEDDYFRTLPACKHAFHVDCIDVWLRSHPNCPLCRAGIFRPESPFTPLMADMVRPNLDEIMFEATILEPLTETPIGSGEIALAPSPRRRDPSEDRMLNDRDLLLKRSYSFGFERNLESERVVLGQPTTSPWRSRRGAGGGGGFWNKRASPFSSLIKPIALSSRHPRFMRSPFFRRRGSGAFFPLSEPSIRSGSSSRRRMFMRSPSRLRSGDPEALLSPERLTRR